MTKSHLFLERLGLDAGADADARAIRRAYARELKQIDQQGDPDSFQQLRDSYEAALAWAAWMQARQAQAAPAGATDRACEAPPACGAPPAPETQAAPAPPRVAAGLPAAAAAQDGATMAAAAAAAAETAGQPPAPWQVGRSAFDAFCAAMPELMQRRAHPPEQPWTAVLHAMLADGRLLNFDARLSFEAHLAQLLAEGWRSGHEILLPACAQVFGWDRDRRALARLGPAGAALDQAIEEGAAFAAQEPKSCASQREVLAVLRAPEAPDLRWIMLGMEALEQLTQHFPHWMALVAPADKAGSWRERYRGHKGKAFEVQEPPPAPKRVLKPPQNMLTIWAGATVLLLLLKTCDAG